MAKSKVSAETVALAQAVLKDASPTSPATVEAAPEARVTNSSKVRSMISALKSKGLPAPTTLQTPVQAAQILVTERAVKELGMAPALAKRYVAENWEKAA